VIKRAGRGSTAPLLLAMTTGRRLTRRSIRPLGPT
jgi:hypothetical protein